MQGLLIVAIAVAIVLASVALLITIRRGNLTVHNRVVDWINVSRSERRRAREITQKREQFNFEQCYPRVPNGSLVGYKDAFGNGHAGIIRKTNDHTVRVESPSGLIETIYRWDFRPTIIKDSTNETV